MSDGSSQQDEQATIDRRSADFGLVCTHSAEIRPLLKQLDRVRKYVDEGIVFRGGFLDETLRIAVAEAGPGFARHRAAAQTLLREHHPAWILSVGFSSPLTSALSSGDICLANEICDTHGNSLPVKCSIPESKRVFVKRHVVADRQPRLAAERTSLAESTGAAVVDISSLAVAQVCQEETEQDNKRNTRFLSIRGVVGTADSDLEEKVALFLFEAEPMKAAVSFQQLFQRIKPDPVLSPWRKTVEESAVNLNRYVLSVIRRLAENINR